MRFPALESMYWVGLGLLVGYIWWRLPDHLYVARERLQAWRETLPWNAREIARIEGAFTEQYTPLEEPRPFLWERIRAYFEQMEIDTRPRKPQQIAEEAYRRALKDW